MGERARVFEEAAPSQLPVLAHLCFELRLVSPHELFALLVTVEVALGFFYGRQFRILFYPFLSGRALVVESGLSLTDLSGRVEG